MTRPQAVPGGSGTGELPPLQVGPLLASFERHSVDYVVIGGVAAQLHGDTHPTRALDVTPAPHAPNLERLRAVLLEADAREYVPGFGFPLQLPMDRRRLTSDAPLRTITRFGPMDVIPCPHGFDSPLPLFRRARHRHAYGLLVPVAHLGDLIHSHTMAGRAKDGPIRARLCRLDSHIREHGLQLAHEQQAAPEPAARPDIPAVVEGERRIHAALDASAALATVFDDIRPALASARRQLYHALDDTAYSEGKTAVRRIQIARGAVNTAHTEIVALRRKLQPGATDRQLAEPPPLQGHSDGAAVLAYQAHDETSTTRRLLGDIEPNMLNTAAGRDLLIEARIHLATAEAHLDLLQIQLERTARVWDLPEHGPDISGPEL